jgi:hypothetical protein
MPRRLNTIEEVLISDIVAKVKRYIPELTREQIIIMFSLDTTLAAGLQNIHMRS